jgi:hypothetical protein
MSVWVPPNVLNSWSIPFSTVVQMPGEMMVLAPSAYHQGQNCGSNLAEALNMADGASEARAAGYICCSSSCSPYTEKGHQIELV